MDVGRFVALCKMVSVKFGKADKSTIIEDCLVETDGIKYIPRGYKVYFTPKTGIARHTAILEDTKAFSFLETPVDNVSEIAKKL